ncbi:MAG: methyl-accepting chemotaxis protein [Gammaproteobacteria bacterium]|nr:methyl-accepting chemotaxis protein [Gammaproteobacteria bacterium]
MNISIKARLIVIAIIMFVAILSIMALDFYSKSQLSVLEKSLNLVHLSKSNMLTLRRNEKDFLARKDLKYHEKFNKNAALMQAGLQTLSQRLQQQQIDNSQVIALIKHTDEYQATFDEVVAEQKIVGLNSKDGLYGDLRASVHAAEATIKQLKDDKLFKDMLMLRRREKDFMLRLDLKYIDKFNNDMQVIVRDVNNSSYSSNVKQSMLQDLKQYEKDFLNLVEGYKVKGLSPKEGLLGELRTTIHKTEGLLKSLGEELPLTIEAEKSTLVSLSVGLAVVVMLLALSFIGLTIRSIIKPINHLAAVFTEICESKDLTLRAGLKGNDELAQISDIFNKMLESFRESMQQVLDSAGQLSNMSGELTAITEQTSNRVMQQLSETEQVSSAIHEMSATIHEVAQNAGEAAASSQAADEEASLGQTVVEGNSKNISELVSEISQTADVITELSKESENIGSVLNVIRDIAEQTNLLALNAAIEAARAGEQGRGFAVVADEVRSLAQRSQHSTQEIKDIVDRLQMSAGRAVSAMASGRDKAETSAKHADSVRNSLNKIIASVATINQMNIQIATASEEQSSVSEEINRNIVIINQTVNETADVSNKTTSMSNALADLALNMKAVISQFKI